MILQDLTLCPLTLCLSCNKELRARKIIKPLELILNKFPLQNHFSWNIRLYSCIYSVSVYTFKRTTLEFPR